MTEQLKEQEVIEGNKLIAEFMEGIYINVGEYMGYEFPVDPENRIDVDVWWKEDALKYHRSFSWLIPAWARFVKIYHELGRKNIYFPDRKLRSEFADAIDKGNISKCYEILCSGIKWYNSQQKAQGSVATAAE